MTNPYTLNPVDDASYYTATGERGRLARRVAKALVQDAPAPSHVSLVGERRIGKTSTLRYLARELRGADGVAVATIDMLSLVPSDPTGFYGMLTRSLRRAKVIDRDTTLSGPMDLLDLIDHLCDERRRLVLLIDELDVVARHRNFNIDFFETLRSAASHDELVLVAASVTPLSEIAEDDQWGSPFFNIFMRESLGLLDGVEAEALIARGFDGDTDVAEPIAAVAGRHPFLLQLACHNAWRHRDDAGAALDPVVLRERLERDVHPHFNFVWEHSPSAERDAMMALARGDEPAQRPLGRLRERGYVEGDALFAPAFRDFLLELASEDDPGDPDQARLPALMRRVRTDASQPRRNMALVIGVNRYKHERSGRYRLASLRYAERDATAMADLLSTHLDFEVETLIGPEATAVKVKRAFDEFEQATRCTTHPDSTFVFHFSGHGQLDPEHDEKAHLVLYTTDPEHPADEGLRMDRLVDVMLPRVHLPRALVLLDACHAGFAAGVKDVAADDKGVSTSPARVANIAQQLFSDAVGRLVLAACAGDEKAREEEALEHGVFTYYLLQHWRDLQGDHPSDGITFGSLVDYVGRLMREHPNVPEPVYNTAGQGPMPVLRALSAPPEIDPAEAGA